MTWPAAWQKREVTWTCVDSHGVPCKGRVLFYSSQVVVVDGVTVVPRVIEATLDANGQMSVMLPTTDDPDINPKAGWAYQVFEQVTGGRKPYWIELPVGAGPFDLSDVIPVDPPDQPQYTLVPGPAMQLSTTKPKPLGTPAPGNTGKASDAGHVHKMPTAAQVGAAVAGYPIAAINEQTAPAYTLVDDDVGKMVRVTSGTAAAVTIPAGLPVLAAIPVIQGGAGAVTITAGGGVTLEAPHGAATNAQGDYRVAFQRADDLWVVA